jgi:hemerythrin-like domain-containing protein
LKYNQYKQDFAKEKNMDMILTRREMVASVLLCTAPAMGALPLIEDGLKNVGAVSPEGGISAAEDLMREHGVLDRILLIYEECVRRIEAKEPFDADMLYSAARLVQNFVEDYHEKLEEDYIFPRFENTGRLTDLTQVLRKQHEAGRVLTSKIVDLADEETLKESPGRLNLVHCLRQFIRLYRPHKAREDTVLFPAIHSLLTERELAALGDAFEDKEQESFGKDGFEKVVEDVAALERSLGIYDLPQFSHSRK